MPKNISDKPKPGNYKGYSNNNNIGYEGDVIRNKKKKANESFEKEKKTLVSIILYI